MSKVQYNIDFYKADHRSQYPVGTEQVFSNWTPRGSRMPGVDHVVFFGLQYYLDEYLERRWHNDFFKKAKDAIIYEYRNRMVAAGIHITVDHMADLHDLGYMPMSFWALPEGTAVPLRCPMFVMYNTLPEFFWLTNYLETQISSVLWGACTSATIANEYRKLLLHGMRETGGPEDFVDFQGHDFSYRGMYGTEAAEISGAAHLLSFKGTDSMPAIDFLMEYYDADPKEVGGSIPATEHSVMCMGTKDDEIGTYERLITKVYPFGPVSIVSDTWDYWKVLTEFLPQLKDKIMQRDGKLVIRPDSGDPVKIICGDRDAKPGTPEYKGTFECLWDVFGGTVNDHGYKELDPHIGAIYGDSITLERAERIIDGLTLRGFVPNLVLGIGSYTYQYVTRDTFGFAIKATAGIVDGKVRAIFKDPKTDDGTKRSLNGYVAVYRDEHGNLFPRDNVDMDAVHNCEFVNVWKDGDFECEWTVNDIRERLAKNVK